MKVFFKEIISHINMARYLIKAAVRTQRNAPNLSWKADEQPCYLTKVRFNKTKLVLETKVLNRITKYTISKNL